MLEVNEILCIKNLRKCMFLILLRNVMRVTNLHFIE